MNKGLYRDFSFAFFLFSTSSHSAFLSLSLLHALLPHLSPFYFSYPFLYIICYISLFFLSALCDC